MAFSSPAQYLAHASGWAAMASSTMASNAETSMASKPLAAAITSASPPPLATSSASTVLAWVEVNFPLVSITIMRARSAAGTLGRAPCSAYASFTCTSARATSAPDSATAST